MLRYVCKFCTNGMCVCVLSGCYVCMNVYVCMCVMNVCYVFMYVMYGRMQVCGI